MAATDALVIRPALPDDADAMGEVHVRAWQAAYRGVMPDQYLDGLSAAERGAMWRRHLDAPEAPPVLVAELDGQVVGFAVFGSGQLFAINLDPDCWGRGIGRRLLRAATDALAALGFAEAVLWVVPQNLRARGLYESEGWATDGGFTTDEVLGVRVDEIRYVRPLF